MFPAIGNPVLIIANPLYDSVFKALMEDTETAKGLVSVLIERNVIHLQLLTHDALFVQIPKIGPRPEGRLERLLAVFDQRRKLEGDSHRLAVEEELIQTDPVLERMLQTLNRLQESQEMEQIMTLEDLYQLEQEQLNLELEATRDALRKEQTRREEEQRRREEEQRRREEEQRFREEEQRLRVEQQALLQQEQSLRESAEQELQRLRTLLKDLGHG